LIHNDIFRQGLFSEISALWFNNTGNFLFQSVLLLLSIVASHSFALWSDAATNYGFKSLQVINTMVF